MKTTNQSQNPVLGIDIAKDTFDVALLRETNSLTGTFNNNLKGYCALQKWLEKHKVTSLHACMEATGHYGDDLADFLHEQKHQVSVVNPARIKAYAESQMRRNKTDREDAQIIAHFCLTQQPDIWTPPTEAQRELRTLSRRVDVLKDDRQRELNRLEATPKTSVVRPTIKAHIAFLDQQIVELNQKMNDYIDQDPLLQKRHDLLTSIQGIGNITASSFLSEIPDVKPFLKVTQLTAYAGLFPAQHTSGSSVHRPSRLSKMGHVRLRSLFFMPALSAIRFNPVVRDLAERLRKRGKSKMVIIGAAMRKLLHLVYGVLKTGKPFDPDHCSVNLQVTP